MALRRGTFCFCHLRLIDIIISARIGDKLTEAISMSMDPNPRKRASGGTAAEEEPRTRRRSEEEDTTDEEVEEFFAILGRIREAARHLGAGAADHGAARPKGRGDGGSSMWQPAFVPEDFEHPGAAESGGDRRERAEKDGKWRTMSPGGGRRFDLNEEPADS